ncbi:MAG: DUF6046 domain-containing protein [Muribaculaceae bacterium]
MKQIEYELSNIVPKADAGYSGNMLDPLGVRINKALGSFGAIPPYIILPKKDIITSVEDPESIVGEYTSLGVVHSQMPIKVKRVDDMEWFTLPIEPLVSISGKNVIVRRTVAKATNNGTIKERWSQDDYTVSIMGVMSSTDESLYPEDYVRKMIELFNERQSIEVAQDILLLFGIKYLAIESASFPHTKGLSNQNFEIKAYSDSNAELLISI